MLTRYLEKTFFFTVLSINLSASTFIRTCDPNVTVYYFLR